MKKSQDKKVRKGSLVCYRYPTWDLGIVLDIKLGKKNEEIYLIRWPETNEELWMSGMLFEVVSY